MTAAVAFWSNISGGELKPNSSEVSTSSSPPRSAPSGAKTVLHELAKDSAKVPPHGASCEFAISRPMSEFELSTGNSSSSETMPASSAPVVVITLKVDPGGWGDE